ncbi:MAG: hypothetical protein ABSD72_07145 [Terracidiphilus sp.]|jgi:hypothetical protein
MRTIAQSHILLRNRLELPEGIRLATEEFREDWSFVRSRNVLRLEKQLVLHGWSFVRIADGAMRSGVGDTSQEAIASGLKLALRHINTHFNAAEVEYIELTQYPWFALARVRVLPCIIRRGAALSGAYESEALPVIRSSRHLSAHKATLYPHFDSGMPQLKKMLILSKTEQIVPQ